MRDGIMTMIDHLGVEPKGGEVGIELEIEGDGCGRLVNTNFWRVEADGSLRGESAEIVMKNPCKRTVVRGRLKALARMVEHVQFQDTGRAGIHVHINIQELTVRELVQYMCLYLVFEEMLVEWCGQGRVGNLFCLRVSDAPFVLKIVRDVLKSGRWRRLGTDDIRYSSMNLKAVATYGSLEFRALRSTTDMAVLRKWVDILLHLKDTALKFKTPGEIIEQMSHLGSERFFHMLLGEYDVQYSHSGMVSGVRNAQFLAYAKDNWTEEKAADPMQIRPGAIMKHPQDVIHFINPFENHPQVNDVHRVIDDQIRKAVEGIRRVEVPDQARGPQWGYWYETPRNTLWISPNGEHFKMTYAGNRIPDRFFSREELLRYRDILAGNRDGFVSEKQRLFVNMYKAGIVMRIGDEDEIEP